MDSSQFHDANLRVERLQDPLKVPTYAKSLEFLEKFKGKENQAIKAYNHIHNRYQKPQVDSPEMVNLIIEAMKQCSNPSDKSSSRATSRDNSHNNTPRLMKVSKQGKETPHYKIDSERRDLKKLNDWLSDKLDNHKAEEKQGAAFITQRIHSLHLAYSEVCRHAGKYSQPLAETLVTVQREYHDMYQNLLEFLMQQNRKLKKTQNSLEQKMNTVISHYQKELLTIRAEYQKKSAKVIENFHRCVNMKQELEEQNKKLSTSLKSEKRKLQYVEEGLAKSMNILVEIGNEKFKFLSSEQEKVVLSMCSNINSCPQNYKLFHKWCSTVIHSILVMKKEKETTNIKRQDDYLKNFALSAIGKFMIDFDPSLSMQDIEDILFNFAPNYSPKVLKIPIEIPREEKVPVQRKMKVPNLRQISQKFLGVSVEIQTGIMLTHSSIQVQATATMTDTGSLIKPKQKTKETSTIAWIKERQWVSRQIDLYIWGEKPELPASSKAKNVIRMPSVKTQEIVTKITAPSQKVIQPNSIKKKSELKPPPASNREKLSTPAASNNNKIDQIITIFKSSANVTLQPSERSLNKEPTKKMIESRGSTLDKDLLAVDSKSKVRLNSSRRGKRQNNVKFLDNSNNKISRGEDSVVDESSVLQTQLGITSLMDIPEKGYKLSKSNSLGHIGFSNGTINEAYEDQNLSEGKILSFKSVRRRKGAMSSNFDQFISDIVDRRSMKNFKGKEPTLTQDSSVQEKLLLSLIKIPKNILKRKNGIAEFSVHQHLFMIEMMVRLQEKTRKITQSTMWNYKKNGEIQKMALKVYRSKEKISLNSNNLENLLIQIKTCVDPILSSHLKNYTLVVDSDNNLTVGEFRKELMTGKKLAYYHRLAPLISSLFNNYSNFGISRAMKTTSILHKSIKIFKKFEPKLDIYEELLEGTVLELDLFIKIVYHLSEEMSLDFYSQTISMTVLQLKLYFIVEFYLNPMEITSLISSLRTMKKQNGRKSSDFQGPQVQEKMSVGQIALKIFKTVKHKKFNLFKKHHHILKYLSGGKDYITFNDLVYFCEVLPIDSKLKRKIIFNSSLHINYWSQKEPALSIETLAFVLDGLGMKGMEDEKTSSSRPVNILHQYFLEKCQNQLKKLYDKISARPEYVVESIYQLFYKVPPIIHRLTQQAKLNKDRESNLVMLTILYNRIIEQEVERIYTPGFLNAFTSIPLPF